MTNLLDQPARAIAAAIRAGDATAAETVAASLARCRALKSCNAFVAIMDDAAMEAAMALDRMPPDARRKLPLLGVPFAAKDMTPTEGVPTTLGSWSGPDTPATETALVVRRLQAAGAVLVGKTTTPEFAHSGFTTSPRWGVTRNPRDESRSPGGSSGGSGAAVAGGCVPFAEGTDMGGSVRIPAAFCGVVGLKPSLGRIPMTILPSLFDDISHFGPIARTVADAALFMAAAAGPSDDDPFSLPLVFDEAATHPATGLAGQKFALSIDLGFFAVAEPVRAAITAAVEQLRDAGAIVTEVDIPWTREVVDRWTDLWGVFMAAYFGDRRTVFADRLDPHVLALMRLGKSLGAPAVKRIELVRSRMWRDMMGVLATHEALLCPTCAILPPPVTQIDDDYAGDDAAGRFTGLDMCSPFNMVPMLPAISLPVPRPAGALPVGLQMVGRRHGDEALLALARLVERAFVT